MKKKIIMGLFVLATVIGMGFAEAELKRNDNKSGDYYNGYLKATSDYSNDNAYNPSWCNDNSTRSIKNGRTDKKESDKNSYDCIKGYQDSWKENSEAASKTKTENTNN